MDLIPAVLPYEHQLRGKIKYILAAAYPEFLRQVDAAPKEALVGMVERLLQNPVGYMSENFLGGIGSGSGAGLRSLNLGVDAADEFGGAMGDYMKSRNYKTSSIEDFMQKYQKFKS